MKEALEWWNSLTEAGKNQFPATKNKATILQYYLNPADYVNIN
jgi:hypothetical protein